MLLLLPNDRVERPATIARAADRRGPRCLTVRSNALLGGNSSTTTKDIYQEHSENYWERKDCSDKQRILTRPPIEYGLGALDADKWC